MQKKQKKTIKKETVILAFIIGIIIGLPIGATITIIKLTPDTNIVTESRASQHNHKEFSPQQVELLHDLEKEISSHPENHQAWTALANLYHDTKQFSLAIEAYKHSLELSPKNPDTWTDLGIMYRRSGQPQQAIKAFDQAINNDPTHEQSRFNKGIVFLNDLKDTEAAIQAWQELVDMKPDANIQGKPVKDMIQDLKNSVNQIP